MAGGRHGSGGVTKSLLQLVLARALRTGICLPPPDHRPGVVAPGRAQDAPARPMDAQSREVMNATSQVTGLTTALSDLGNALADADHVRAVSDGGDPLLAQRDAAGQLQARRR